MLIDFECPKCKGHVCEIWGLDGSNLGIRLMYWLMIWSPGLGFSELILGQRSPSRVYICKACELPFIDRSYVHCPECDRFHNGRLWSRSNAFGHWFGLFCPDCAAPIPSLLNVTSRLLLWATTPVRRLFLRGCQNKLFTLQHKRIVGAQIEYLGASANANETSSYVFIGLISALILDLVLSLFSALVVGYFRHGDLMAFLSLYAMYLLTGLLICLPTGAIAALAMKMLMEKKGDVMLHLTYDSAGQVVPLRFDDEPEDGGKE